MLAGSRIAAETAAQAAAASVSGLDPSPDEPLMRSRHCIRFEEGLCPVYQGAKNGGPLFLLNNGRRIELRFDCKRCEMLLLRS